MTETSNNTAEETKEVPTMETLRKMAEMKHSGLSNLLGIYIDSFSAIMINGNGTSYAKKVQAALALKEAVLFAMDFGLGVTNPKIREQGTALSKEVNGLAGVMVQTLDNRMLLLADKMSKDIETKEQTKTNETVGEIKND